MTKQILMALILLSALLLQVAVTNNVLAAPARTPVTLYAHGPPGGETSPILNAVPQWGQGQVARLQRGEAVFTLDPPLGQSIVIDGTTAIRLWVRSDNRLVGFLAVYITEETSDGRSILTHPVFNDTVFLTTLSRDINYLVAISNFTVEAGAVLQLHVALASTDHVTGVYLLYDALTTPTQITIPTEGATSAQAAFFNPQGKSASVFETPIESTNVTLTVRTNITDAFGLYRLGSILLTISNSSGTAFFKSNILGELQILSDYGGTYETTVTLPDGIYTATITTTDQSGYLASNSARFFVSVFYNASFRVTDPTRRPITGAQVILVNQYSNYSALTNQTGWATVRAPSSDIVGQYSVVVDWKNLTVLSAVVPSLDSDTILYLSPNAFDLNLRIKMLSFDLPGVNVDLISDGFVVNSSLTNSTGSVLVPDIPPGNYSVVVHYFGVQNETNVVVNGPTTVILQVPVPWYVPYVIILIVALAAVSIFQRRRMVYGVPFDYITQLTKDGFPESLTTTIVGPSGSGKTVLMQSLADRSLKEKRGCIYVTNVEMPDNVRKAMSDFGMDVAKSESDGKLLFIDCYSALSGSRPAEKRALSSFTDLTSLGILITTAIEDLHGVTDVFFDSITPLFTTLKADYVVTFLQSIGAKVKSNNGRLFATIGTSIEKGVLNRVEELSDCIIETQLMETRGGQRRRLRVKKLRGHPYSDAWTMFTIHEKGITFLTRKPYTPNSKVKEPLR